MVPEVLVFERGLGSWVSWMYFSGHACRCMDYSLLPVGREQCCCAIFLIMLLNPHPRCVSIVSTCLFVCALLPARGRLPIFSSCMYTVGFLTPGMDSLGLFSVSCVPVGSRVMCS